MLNCKSSCWICRISMKIDKLILENKQIRLENEKQTYFYLFLFVFILGLGIIAFFLVRKRYRTKIVA